MAPFSPGRCDATVVVTGCGGGKVPLLLAATDGGCKGPTPLPLAVDDREVYGGAGRDEVGDGMTGIPRVW